MKIQDNSILRRIGKKLNKYLTVEVIVDYKDCLYFFVILFFYAVYLLLHKVYAASLLHMAEIILSTYGMGYLQILVMGNFDEAESFTKKELFLTLLCSLLYAALSYLFGWFDRSPAATGIFAVYCIIAYLSAYLANKIKRKADTEQLNELLRTYQKGGNRNERH